MQRRRILDAPWLDGLIAATLTVGLELQLLHGGRATALNVLGGALLTAPLAGRRRAPLALAGVFAATAALNALLGGELFRGEPPPFPSLIAGAVAFYSVGAFGGERRAAWGAGIGVAGLWVCVIANGQIDPQSFLFSSGLIVLTPWLVGRSMRARSLRLALLQRELLQRERVAVGEERARIARELHDVVAHSVGAIVAQAQGARRVLDSDPERAREALAAIERTGRAALEEMRRSLGVLRRQGTDAPLAPQPGLGSLDALLDQARQSGMTVELTTDGEPAPLPVGVDLSAYRIVQEALTNTLKHAGPVHARVAVRYASGQLELEISDDGPPGRAPNGAVAGGGHGLVGMRERVALYGGSLRAAQRPEGGFVVRASLPLGS